MWHDGRLELSLCHPERSEGSRARKRAFAGAGRRSVRRDSSLQQPSLRMTTGFFLAWVRGRATTAGGLNTECRAQPCGAVRKLAAITIANNKG
jgi:hypothetical protein